jgi:hypothetical protein
VIYSGFPEPFRSKKRTGREKPKPDPAGKGRTLKKPGKGKIKN